MGNKRALLANLSGRTGVICEVVTTEEWDEIIKVRKCSRRGSRT